MADPKLIQYAREKFDDVNMIINLFTMRFEWTDEKTAKILEYSQKEIEDKSVRDIVKIDVSSLLGLVSGSKNDKRTLITKSGKEVSGIANIKAFRYDNEQYIAILGAKFS